MALELKITPNGIKPPDKSRDKKSKPLQSKESSPPAAPKTAKISLLKTLRESKKISRKRLGALTEQSCYQIESLESGNFHKLLDKVLECTKVMGFEPTDVMSMLVRDSQGTDDEEYDKGTIGKTVSSKTFQNGSKLHTYLDKNGYFYGKIELCRNNPLEMSEIHSGDLTFGIVRKGVLTIDFLLSQKIHEKDSFFILPGKLPYRLANESNYNWTTDIDIFSVKFPS